MFSRAHLHGIECATNNVGFGKPIRCSFSFISIFVVKPPILKLRRMRKQICRTGKYGMDKKNQTDTRRKKPNGKVFKFLVVDFCNVHPYIHNGRLKRNVCM